MFQIIIEIRIQKMGKIDESLFIQLYKHHLSGGSIYISMLKFKCKRTFSSLKIAKVWFF